MVIDLDFLIQKAGQLTVVAILLIDIVVLVVGLQRRWWIPGFLHAEIVDERDKKIVEITADRDLWRQTALRQFDLTEAAVGGIRHVARKD